MLKKIATTFELLFLILLCIFVHIQYNINRCYASANYDMYEENEEENNDKKTDTYTIADPFEKLNRKIFNFNIFLLNNIAGPISNVYVSITGEDLRYMIGNFDERFDDLSTLANSILQFNIKNTFKTLTTFTINTVFGVFGLFNPIEKLGFYREKKTISDTLAFYRVGDGFFIMLPFLGPSTLRDTFSLCADYFINPLSYDYFELLNDNEDLSFLNNWRFYVPKRTITTINKFDLAIDMNEKFISHSIDPYNFVKNAYIQNKISKSRKNK